MMYKKNSSPYKKWAYALCIPVFSLLLMSFAPVKKTFLPSDKLNTLSYSIVGDSIAPPTPPTPPKMVLPEAPTAPPAPPAPPSSDSIQEVEEVPRFPGCEEIKDKSERSMCSKQELLKFIYSSLKYPKEAQKANQEGMVVIKFIVKKDGSLSDFKVVRSVCPSLDNETIRVANTMPRWIPGKKGGKVVDVAYTLPVRFKLANDKK